MHPGQGSSQAEAWHPPLYPFCPARWLELTASFLCLSAHPGLPAPPCPPSTPPWPARPPRQCSVTCGEGIQQRQVVCRTNANSLGQCEGAKPDTIQACSLPACGGEPGRMGVGQLLWPRPEAQPDWLPSPLVPPSTRASSPPLPGNLQNSTVKADVWELVTPEGQWVPQSGPLDPINKISSSKYISGPYPFPSLAVSGITSMGRTVEQTQFPVCPCGLSLLR